jgi:hypothetical protein
MAMSKLAAAFLVLSLCVLHASAQDIQWDKHEGLTWSDFTGEPNTASQYHASTQSGVQYASSWSGDGKEITLTFTVFAYFDPDRSWVKPWKGTDRLLEHEQLHFDISELHARKLKRTLSTYPFSKRHEKELKALFEENTAQRNTMQAKYDLETDHMVNRDAQARWEEFIQEELDRLRDFAVRKIAVTFALR